MKKIVIWLMLLSGLLTLAACGTGGNSSGDPSDQIANPWVEYDSLQAAEEAAGFPLGMPESIADCQAQEFRVMDGKLLEVVYRSEDEAQEISVRKQAGEGQDISGDYNEYPTVTEQDRDGEIITIKTDGAAVQTVFSCGGYSYSIYAPAGYAGDSAEDFLSAAFAG